MSFENNNPIELSKESIKYANEKLSPDINLDNLLVNTEITRQKISVEYQWSIEDYWNNVDKLCDMCWNENFTKWFTNILDSHLQPDIQTS